MSDYQTAIGQLEDESNALPRGPAQVSLLEEAVRLADTHGDADEGFRLRTALAAAAVFGGRPDVLMVAFSWCVAQYDRDPGHFQGEEEYSLLWRYKWAVENLVAFPQVSRADIDKLLDDMERRYRAYGASMHAVHHKRRKALSLMGDMAAAAEADRQMARARPDGLSDCTACVQDNGVEYLLLQGKDPEALLAAQPLLAGRMSCAEIPHRTFGRVLLPLVRAGRVPEAMAHHQRGYRMVASNPAFMVVFARHIVFLCLTDNLAKALKLVERHLPDALAAPGALDRFEFYVGCKLLLERLDEQGKPTIKIRLPATLPMHDPNGRYKVAELSRWFGDELRDLAAQFDARNGNHGYSGRIAELQEVKKLVIPCPLTTPK